MKRFLLILILTVTESLCAFAQGHVVALSWNPSVSTGQDMGFNVGYFLYRGASLNSISQTALNPSPVDPDCASVSSCVYVDRGCSAPGQTCYYVLRATWLQDTSLLSPASNVAMATIPNSVPTPSSGTNASVPSTPRSGEVPAEPKSGTVPVTPRKGEAEKPGP